MMAMAGVVIKMVMLKIMQLLMLVTLMLVVMGMMTAMGWEWWICRRYGDVASGHSI